MFDVFYEQILPVELDIKKRLIRSLIIGIAVSLFWILVFLGGFFGATIGALILYLVFSVLLPKFKIDYEYSLTNHHFQIAAIYNKASRKEKFALDLPSAEIIAPVGSPRLKNYGNAELLHLASADEKFQSYSIIIKSSQTLYNIVIQPDDKMRDLLKRQAPSRMFFD